MRGTLVVAPAIDILDGNLHGERVNSIYGSLYSTYARKEELFVGVIDSRLSRLRNRPGSRSVLFFLLVRSLLLV